MVVAITTNTDLLKSLYIPIEYAGCCMEVTEMYIIDPGSGRKIKCYETEDGIILPVEVLTNMEASSPIQGMPKESFLTTPSNE